MNTKIVYVNQIVVSADFNGLTAFDAVMQAAVINKIHNFDVEVDERQVDVDEIKEIGVNWAEININTSEKPAFTLKVVTVNQIVVDADFNGLTAFDAVMQAAVINKIHNFDVDVDDQQVDADEIKEIGAEWTEINIKTSEKPA